MNYAEIATRAKAQARDILRAQMAIRIQDRYTGAKRTLVNALREKAHLLASFSKADKKQLKADEDDAAEDFLFAAVVAEFDVTDAALVNEAMAEELAAEAETRRQFDIEREDARGRQLETAEANIVTAREALTHVEENLVKLEAGELKVDKDALKDLANQLITEGRVTDEDEG